MLLGSLALELCAAAAGNGPCPMPAPELCLRAFWMRGNLTQTQTKTVQNLTFQCLDMFPGTV